MPIRSRSLPWQDRDAARQIEFRFTLPLTHTISAANEIREWHVKPPINEELSILPRDDDVILLAEITHDVIDRDRHHWVVVLGFQHDLTELIAPLGDLSSAAHPDSLYLLWTESECLRE